MRVLSCYLNNSFCFGMDLAWWVFLELMWRGNGASILEKHKHGNKNAPSDLDMSAKITGEVNIHTEGLMPK